MNCLLMKVIFPAIKQKRVNYDYHVPINSMKLTSKNVSFYPRLRACLHGGGGPQVGEVARLGGVTCLYI